MSTAYSLTFLPPAPVLDTTLALRNRSPEMPPVPALIDTGADGTFIPIDYLIRLEASVAYQGRVYSHLGGLQVADTYTVDIVIGSLRLSDVDVVGDIESQQIILGRNVLNKLILLLDGPQALTDILDRSPVRGT